MQDSFLPIVLGVAGACLSFLAMLVVALIGFFVRFMLQSIDRRVGQVETDTKANAAKLAAHGEQLASAATQTENEQRSIEGLWGAVNEMRNQLGEFGRSLTEAIGLMRRSATPPGMKPPSIPR